jgi:phytoene/squalene synthetase
MGRRAPNAWAHWPGQSVSDAQLAGRDLSDHVDDPVLPAVLHTVRAFDLDPSDFERFLDSMAMDLHTGGWSS